VKIDGVTKRFGSLTVLQDINLTINEGEAVVVVGPSGSGKSTLLRCINVLEEINEGDIFVDGLNLTRQKTAVGTWRYEMRLSKHTRMGG